MALLRGFYLRLIFLLALIAGTIALFRYVELGRGWILAAVAWLLFCGILSLVRYSERQGAKAGALTPALQRYNRRVLGATLAYVVGLFAAIWLFKEWHPTGPTVWLIALLPTIGALAMVWAMVGLLREETDEYIRSIVVRQAMFGNAFLLVVATIWGFFEQFDLVPHIPAWGALPVFAVGLMMSAVVKGIRA